MDLLSLFVLWTSKAFDKSGSLNSCETANGGGCQGISLLCYKIGLIYYVMLVFAGDRGP